jgi:hypothetical protein
VGHIGLLINDQTIQKIIGKMPYTDWKEWVTRRPEWIHENFENVFEKFVEQKWKDALNMAASEPGSWEAGGCKVEKTPTERAASLARKATTASSSANAAVVDVSARGRRCQFFRALWVHVFILGIGTVANNLCTHNYTVQYCMYN